MTDADIVPDTIRSLSVLYFASMLEQLRAFDVVDAIVEQVEAGMLPIRGPGGWLPGRWREVGTSPSAHERLNAYAEAFGGPAGDPGVSPNREFDGLWLRFVAAVAALGRRLDDGPLHAVPADQGALRSAARALAVNLSARPAALAPVVQDQIHAATAVLSDPEIQAAFGARDIWHVIERASIDQLGTAPNTVRARTQATSGVTAFVWLAKRAGDLSAAVVGPLLDVQAVRQPRPVGAGPSTDPTDGDLVDACERWLGATGVGDGQVDEYARPEPDPPIDGAVRALLCRSAAYQQLAPAAQDRIAVDTAKVADFLLASVDFPASVAGLIHGVFGAIVDATAQQMDAYQELIANVADSIADGRLDDAREDAIGDRLVERFPDLFAVEAEPCDRRQPRETRHPRLAWMLATGIGRLVAAEA